ncbi:MAG: InlB B-repeat-containing protein [Clostridia bacterium]|nr:InlB B-repeat-containing protein [Clostridia bacterium]
MKKAVSLLIALVMIVSVAFTTPVVAYTDTIVNSISNNEANANEESGFMAVIRAIFFSKLSFDSNGGSEIPDQYALKLFGKFKTPTEPTKEGYTFAGWEPEIPSRAPFGNVTVKAKWETNVYQLTWVVDDAVYSQSTLLFGVGFSAPDDPQKEGHTFTGWSPAVAQSMPAHDLTYTAQFTVNSYTATLRAGAGKFKNGTATKTIKTKYGTKISYEEPTREGYSFAGWDIVVPATMPANNFECTATWVARTDTIYTVYFYVMDVDGTYQLNQKNLLKGETDTTVTYTPKPEKGFNIASKSVLSANVAADGSAELKVYYARNQYNIKFDLDNGSAIVVQKCYYGSTVTPPQNPQKEGFDFIGWAPAIAKVTKGMTYKAEWKRATEYVQAATEEEFSDACADLISQSFNNENFDAEEALNDPYYFGRVIVNCDDYSSIDFSEFEAASVVFGTDGTVILQFDTRDQAESCANTLKELSTVNFVEADAYIEVPEDVEVEEIPSMSGSLWGVKYINADKYAYYLENNDMNDTINVAVIDSGIDTDHPYLSGRISAAGANTIDKNNKSNVEDDNGHGTHVAGVIKACTNNLTNIKIVPVKVSAAMTDKDGNAFYGGSPISIRNGITYAADVGCKVINISMEAPYSTASKYIEEAIQAAVEKGCTVVVAAGNGVKGSPIDTARVCPANIENVIVVGALDQTGNKGSFSNYGDSVDVIAPGVDIISSYTNGKYAKASGTSQAAPHIAAVAAMFKLSHKNFTPAQTEAFIKQYCIDKGPAGRDAFYGEGCPDMYNAIPDCTVSFNSNGGSAVATKTTKNSSSVVLPTPTKSYKVTFNANGGTLTQTSVTSSCKFEGWYTTSNFSDTKHIGGESYMLLKDQTLYAKWTSGQLKDANPPTPTRTTYSFEGWYTEPNGGTLRSSTYFVTSDLTLYAHWKRNELSDWTLSSSVPSGTTIEQTKTEYRYIDQYPYYTYSSWSEWQTSAISSSATVEVQTAIVYRYHYYRCQGCGKHHPNYSIKCSCGTKVGNNWNCKWSDIRYCDSGYTSGTYSGEQRSYTYNLGDGQQWFFSTGNANKTAVGTKDVYGSNPKAVVITNGYRSRTVYTNYAWTEWKDDWSETPVSSSPTRQVQTRTWCKYRYN